MIYVAIVVGVLLIAVLLAPFFVGPGGLLATASTVNSPERLEAMKRALLHRYLDDEAAFHAGSFSKATWEKRREFLVHRYCDAARRLDFLRSTDTAAPNGASA